MTLSSTVAIINETNFVSFPKTRQSGGTQPHPAGQNGGAVCFHGRYVERRTRYGAQIHYHQRYRQTHGGLKDHCLPLSEREIRIYVAADPRPHLQGDFRHRVPAQPPGQQPENGLQRPDRRGHVGHHVQPDAPPSGQHMRYLHQAREEGGGGQQRERPREGAADDPGWTSGWRAFWSSAATTATFTRIWTGSGSPWCWRTAFPSMWIWTPWWSTTRRAPAMW